MSTEQTNQRLCDCRSRVGPHERFDTLEAWIVFLVTRGVLSSEVMDQVHDAGLDTNDLFVRLLYTQWHTGKMPGDLTSAKVLLAGWVVETEPDLVRAWERLRSWLVDRGDGFFVFPPLEQARSNELAQAAEER